MRAEESQTRVHYKGESADFIVFVESAEQVNKWRSDKSIPLAQVVNSFHIFNTQQGSQGMLGQASAGTVENEFNTKVTEDAIAVILSKGDIKEMKSREREGNTNITIGTLGGH